MLLIYTGEKMKWIFFSVVVLLFNACSLFEEEPEVLLSNIDGKEYYEVKDGDMNVRKATLYILDGLKDSVDFDVKLDLLDSLESENLIWKERYLKSFSSILTDVYVDDNLSFIEGRIFSFLIHCPNELISHLNNEGFNEIDTWMLVLSRGLRKAIEPEDITSNSVVNALISNCKECDENQQKLIADFVFKLEMFDKLKN